MQNNPIETNGYFPNNPFLFRFTCLFIILFIIVFNNGTFIPFNIYPALTWPILDTAVNWIADVIFNAEHPVRLQRNGSGDSSFQWYSLLLVLITAIIGSIIWTIITRSKKNYGILYYWLTVCIRYYIGIMLIYYGMAKFEQSQFQFPDLLDQVTPLSQMTPMGLAWNFFGASKGYNIFMGIAEVCGILLLFRRTATLGALITLAISLNIMAINYCYNVPVKMVSTALVLFSLYLLAPNIQRIFQFLVLNKSSSLLAFPTPPVKSIIAKRILIGLKYLLILIVLGYYIVSYINVSKLMDQLNNKSSELYGVYYIPSSEVANRSEMGIPSHWEKLIIYQNNALITQNAEMKNTYYQIIIDEKKKELKIISHAGEKGIHASYNIGDKGNITLTDLKSDKPIKLILNKIDMDDIPLKTRRFNWIIGD